MAATQRSRTSALVRRRAGSASYASSLRRTREPLVPAPRRSASRRCSAVGTARHSNAKPVPVCGSRYAASGDRVPIRRDRVVDGDRRAAIVAASSVRAPAGSLCREVRAAVGDPRGAPADVVGRRSLRVVLAHQVGRPQRPRRTTSARRLRSSPSSSKKVTVGRPARCAGWSIGRSSATARASRAGAQDPVVEVAERLLGSAPRAVEQVDRVQAEVGLADRTASRRCRWRGRRNRRGSRRRGGGQPRGEPRVQRRLGRGERRQRHAAAGWPGRRSGGGSRCAG